MKKVVNVSALLTEMAERQPYKRAVVFPQGRDARGRVAYTHLTFRQLDRESDCLAHGLTSAGIARGVRTILMVKPSLDFFALTFALFKVGAVPVVVDPGMGLRRMVACLKESRPQAFIGIPLAHVIRRIYPKFFSTVKVWVTVGRRWFWGGRTLEQIRRRPWQPFQAADTHRDETAAVLFRLNVEEYPDSPLAHRDLGVLLMEEGSSAQARVHLLRARELSPGPDADLDSLIMRTRVDTEP